MSAFDFSGLTCVLPTHNRNRFLARQLEYISQTRDFPNILVVDSSQSPDAAVNRQLCSSIRSHSVSYRYDPAPYFQKMTDALASLDCPHVVLCADDDTLSPVGLYESLKVIRANPDVGSVMGRCYVLNTGTNELSAARGYSITNPDPAKRIQHYLDNWFSNFYAVHHREHLLEQLWIGKETVDVPRSRLLNELLTSLLVITRRAMHYVDCDYLTYQIHEDNLSKHTCSITDPSETEYLVDCVATAIYDYYQGQPGDQPLPRKVLEEMLQSYMQRQRIPGRRRSRKARLQRQAQLVWRKLTGSNFGDGNLESKPLPLSLESIRCGAMRRGLQLTIDQPAGTALRAAA